MMTRHYIVVVMLIAVLATCLIALADLPFGSPVAGDEPELLVEHLGRGEPQAYTTGYVFVELEYVEPPYVFQRIGQGVTLNGKLVNILYTNSLPWTNKVEETNAPIVDPPIPNTLQETDDFSGEASAWARKKQEYLFSKYPTEQGLKKLEEAIAELPMVASVKGFPSPMFTVTTKGGVSRRYLVFPFRGCDHSPVRNSKALWTQAGVCRYVFWDELKTGNALFLSTNAILPQTPGIIAQAPIVGKCKNENFTKAMRVLVSEKSMDEKIRVLQTLKLDEKISALPDLTPKGLKTESAQRTFIEKCSKNKSLINRIKALKSGKSPTSKVQINLNRSYIEKSSSCTRPAIFGVE